jgi:CysZ protein
MNDEDFDSIGISSAIDAFFGGIGFILFTPSVWIWAAVPAALMMVLMCGGTALVFWGGASQLESLFGPDRGTWGAIGYWSLMVLLSVIALLIGTLVGLTLAQPLSGFALEKIAHAQQFKLTGHAGQGLPYFQALLLNLRTVTCTLVVGGTSLTALFLIGLLFSPALVVTVPLKFLVCSWMLAWNFLDYPLGLRGLGERARIHWCLRHFGAFTLFGAGWAGLCVIPGIVLLVLPMGVAGATRLVLRDDPGHRISK